MNIHEGKGLMARQKIEKTKIFKTSGCLVQVKIGFPVFHKQPAMTQISLL